MKLKSIEDVKVVCRHCDLDMVLESNMNNHESIYVCLVCKEHIILSSKTGVMGLYSLDIYSRDDSLVDAGVSKVVGDKVRGLS